MNYYLKPASILVVVAFLLCSIMLPPAAAEPDNDVVATAASVLPETRGPVAPDMFDFDLDITYAIIAPKQFYDKMIPFAEWKTRKGVPAEIFNLDTIYDRYPGLNRSAKLHGFLTELSQYKPATEWLLLVGDSEWIPAPYVRTDLDGSMVDDEFQDFTYSDYYYAGIDTDWDHDNDGIYGEVQADYDWTADFYVGRLPVSNPDELDTVLKKLRTYERTPPDGAWFYNVILAGAVMDLTHGPNIADDPDTFEDDGYNDYKDNALKVNDKVKGILDSNYNFLEFYDYHQLPPGGYGQEGDTLNQANFVSFFNQGALIVNMVSHGYDNGDGHVEYAGNGENVVWNTFFDYENARSSTNGYQLPLVYSSSCTTGNFTETDDTGLERLLTAKNGGAIGFVGATVTTYRGEFRENDTSFGNWWLDEEFFRMFVEGDHKPGRVLYRLKEKYGEYVKDPTNPHRNNATYKQMFRVNQLAYNYLGDPELSIWTAPPGALKLEYDPVHRPQYWDAPMTIRVKNQVTGTPVENARVTISGPDQYSWAETDSNGVAKVPLNASPDTTYDLVATAEDFLAFEGTFFVESRLNLELVADNLTVDKPRVQKGARTNITIKFKNTGSIPATEVELGLFDGEPDTENLIGVLRTFDNVEPDDVRQISIPWTMPGGDHTIHAVLDPYDRLMEYNENDNTAVITVYENNAPVFYRLPKIPVREDEDVQDALDLDNYVWDADFDDELSFRLINSDEPGCRIVIDDSNNIDIFPDPNWYGTCNVSIEVTDGIETALAYLPVEVRPVNDPPELKPVQNQTMIEDEWFELLLFGYDNSDAGDTIFFETNMTDVFTGLIADENYRFDETKGELKFKPDNSMVGDHLVSFRVVDEHGGASPWQSVLFTIINSPDPLVISVLDKYNVGVGGELIIDVQVYDEDVSDNHVFWDDTELFDIDRNTGRIIFKPDAEDAGTHRVTVFVTDGNFTVQETIEITVEGNIQDSLMLILIIVIIIVVVAVIIIMVISHNRRMAQIKARASRSRSKAKPGPRPDRRPERKEDKGSLDDEEE